MGLPRSNLVKSRSTAARAKATVDSTPPPASGIRALELAKTVPQMAPLSEVPPPPPALAAVPRPTTTTTPAPAPAAAAQPRIPPPPPVPVAEFEITELDAEELALPEVDEAAPSTHELLARAAQLGAPRPTFESLLAPNDPVLVEKMQPRAAERRARFQKIVKATVGACVALCVAALIATALSPSEAEASGPPAPTALVSSPAAAEPVVSVEKLDDAVRGKAAVSHAKASVAKAPARKTHSRHKHR